MFSSWIFSNASFWRYLAATLAFACLLTGCRPKSTRPTAPPQTDPGTSFDHTLHVHVVDYKRAPAPNVQLATEQQTASIMQTDVAGNTSIHYRSDRLSLFVLIPKGMVVLAPYNGVADLSKDPEHLLIAPKGKPIILQSSAVLRPLAVQVVSQAPPENEPSWTKAVKVVAKEIELPPDDLARALNNWYPAAETPTDRALAAICRRDFLTAEREALTAVSSPDNDVQTLAVARLVLSQSLYARGDYSASIRTASEAVALQPDNRAFTRSLGFSLRDMGDTPGAAAAFLASGCGRGRPTCNPSETLSTIYAARALESLGLKWDAIGEYRLAFKAGDFPDRALAAKSLERLSALESLAVPRILDWRWISIALLVVTLTAYTSWYVWAQLIRGHRRSIARITMRLNSFAYATRVRALRTKYLVIWAPSVLGLTVLATSIYVYYSRQENQPVAGVSEILGTVNDESHRPIPQATVRVLDFGLEPVQTDNDGRFRIRLPNDRVAFLLVQVEKEGFAPAVEWTDSEAIPQIILHSQ